jgi:hypothetical protein
MLQPRRSWGQFPIRSLDFFNLPNPSSRTIALGSTQPLTEISTRNLPGLCIMKGLKNDNIDCPTAQVKSGTKVGS